MEDAAEELPNWRWVNFPPLPSKRKVELHRTEVESVGELARAGCKAVKYCGHENAAAMEGTNEAAVEENSESAMERKNAAAMEGKNEGALEWKNEAAMGGKKETAIDGKNEGINHEETCSAIKRLVEQTASAVDDLANEFGGVSALLKAPLVRNCLFTFRDPRPWESGPSSKRELPFGSLGLAQRENYLLARWKLTEAYAKYGEEFKNGVAFRRAVDNVLDLICLSYFQELENLLQGRGSSVGWHVYKYSGWMVAADMDQEALNFLCYFPRRDQLRHPLPYLELADDEDVEGDSYFQMLKEIDLGSPFNISGNSRDGWFSEKWFHAFMIIALIKFKRLLVQVKTDEMRWRTFMEGTDDTGVGETSTIWRIRGMAPVLEKLRELVLDQSRNPLTDQIVKLLSAVNDRNPFLIPGILDRKSLEGPTFPEVDEAREMTAPIPQDFLWFHDDETELDRDVHSARFAVNTYGHAWHMEKDYSDALKLFLDTGNVMPNNSPA